MKSRDVLAGVLTVSAAACAGGIAAYAASRRPRVVEPVSNAALDTATESLKKKNQQLEALYTVFSEITESLEIRYVIASTLREAIKLMQADMAVLRKVSGNELISIGAQASTGQEIHNIRPVGIGEGPTGRAFKRGRTVRIDEDGENTMAPATAGQDRSGSPAAQTGRQPMESGLIVPLIIGARVVGTLSCWS